MATYKLDRQGLLFRIEDGVMIPADINDAGYLDYLAWVALGNNTPVDPVSLSDVKTQKLAEINAKVEKMALLLTTGYPDFEMKTWPQQEAESLAWNADPYAATPMIDIMATKRGIPRELYLSKTLVKVGMFRVASSNLVGQRQKYADMVDAATTVEQVQAINPVYSLA